MPLPAVTGWAVAAAAVVMSSLFSSQIHFAPGACDRLEHHIKSTIVGQDLAVRQFSDAVCDHLSQQEPLKPLVVSAHGPVGVGKSLLHLLAAQALYAAKPHIHLRCPGSDCPGYKVLFGMDFTTEDRQQQHAALRSALLEHVKVAPESLIVVEEYDKLDCHMRGFFRQLLEGGQVGNVSLAKSIVVLESNTGYMALHNMLYKAGSRESISPEQAQRDLKDLVFTRWKSQDCEERADTLRIVGLVDFFLPFFPLEKQNIKDLFHMRMKSKISDLGTATIIEYDDAIVDFLLARVDFEGPYPIEGAKEVNTLMTRYVSRPLREWNAAVEQQVQKNKKAGVKQPVCSGRLQVAKNKAGLEMIVLDSVVGDIECISPIFQ